MFEAGREISMWQRITRRSFLADVLTAETFRDIVPIEDDLLAGVGHGQLLADVTLFAVAEDVVQPAGDHVEGSVQVFRSDSTNGKAFVIALKELRQEGVAGVDVANSASRSSLTRRS